MVRAADNDYDTRTAAAASLLQLLVLLVVCLLSAAPRAAAPEQHWLLVDTGKLTLSVMRGDVALKTYDNIAIGSNGTTRSKRVADEKTPLGDFSIIEVRMESRFHRFLAIDYPTMDDAQRALGDGRVSQAEYDSLRRAWSSGGAPPQNTRLGGHIGIQGIGAGDPEIHAAFNWTNGCIALTNQQIEELLQWVGPGTRVSIR